MALEVVLQPALSANADTTVGDAVYVDSLAIDWDETVHSFGKDDAKTPVVRASVSHYDTSVIPMDADIAKAKFEVKASHADDVAFDSDVAVDVLARVGSGVSDPWDPRLNQSTESSHLGPEFIYFPDKGVISSAWADGRLSGNDQTISMPMNIEHGVGSIAQAWTCNVTSVLGIHYWFLERTGSLANTTVTTNIYEASGSAGSYTKGDLLDSGLARTANSISSSGLVAFYIGVSGWPTSGVSLTDGDVYISELVFSGTDTGATAINVGILTDTPTTTDNAIIYARQTPAPARVLQGFGGYTKWMTGEGIEEAFAPTGRTDEISSFPEFAAGSVYPMASSEYSAETNYIPLPKFKENLQTALDARSSTRDWIGIRIQCFSEGTNGAQRRFHSSKSATATTGTYKGMVLTLEYTTPSTFVGTGAPTIKSGVVLNPPDLATREYDPDRENAFRRRLGSALMDVAARTNRSSGAHGREASCASKRERLLPRVGMNTLG